MAFDSVLNVFCFLSKQMCSFAFQLLNRFLSSQDAMLLLLYIINENVRLNVVERSPRMAADSEEGDELQEEGFGLLMMGEAGVAGGEVTAANSQAVKLGLLKDDPEVKYAHEMRVKLEREVEKEEHDKDKGKKKKSLKQDGTKHDDDDGKSNGKATNSTIQFNHAEAEVPIASLDEDEEADFLAGIRRRTIVGTNALPSSVLFTFVNTRQVW